MSLKRGVGVFVIGHGLLGALVLRDLLQRVWPVLFVGVLAAGTWYWWGTAKWMWAMLIAFYAIVAAVVGLLVTVGWAAARLGYDREILGKSISDIQRRDEDG